MSEKKSVGALAGYVYAVAFELVVSVVACVCLCMVSMQGFVVAPDLQFNVALLAVLSAALQVILYAAAYRKRNYLVGIVAYVAASAVLVGVGIATSSGADVMADVEENHLAFCAVVAVVNALVFLLTRSRRGFLAFLAAGLFSCAFVQYAFHANLVVPSVVFAISAAVLVMCRTYAASVRTVDELGRAQASHLRAGMVSSVVACVACVLACAVFALVIEPLDPGHLTVRLFTEYRAFETVEINNPMEIIKVEDPEQKSTNLTSEIIYGSQTTTVTGDDPSVARAQDLIDEAQEQLGVTDEYKLESDDQGSFIYALATPKIGWLLYAAVPVALVAAAVLVRCALRRRRRNRIASHGPAEQVGLIYNAMLTRFARLGLGKAPAATPLEFARASAARMEAFAQGQGATWAEVSALYEDVHYGGRQPSGRELEGAWRFYDGFAARARNLVGRPKYVLKYFWIL